MSPPRLARFVCLLTAAALAVVCVPVRGAATAQPPQPLTPAQGQLLERVRENILADDQLLETFGYSLERRSYDVTFGKVRNGDVRLYDVGPSPFEPGESWRRLVAVNGTPLPAAELRRNEERARRSAAQRARRLASETAPQRARRAAEEARERDERRRQLDDVTRVFRFESMGHEVRDGRSLWVVAIAPRPEARTVTREGGLLKKWRGRAWVDEAEAQAVEVQLEAIDDINIGWGVIGHINRQSTATYRRARLPGGPWLPVEARFRGTGRTLLLIPFQLETWAKYKDYRPVVNAAGGHVADPRR